jgi:starch synthase (maltosyl-transferring)
MLRSLAQAGFQQSYSYFTWRNTKAELTEFFTGIAHETAAYLRPNLFVNTPDILTEYLQFGGVAAYRIRAALAATASPSWGMYAGFELFEHIARPGSEENIDNEKYEYKQRDWAGAEKAGTSLAPYIARLNLIRAAHPALRQLRNLDVHWSDDEAIFVYTKYLAAEHNGASDTHAAGTPGVRDAIIVVANVDPHSVRETTVHLDLTRIGMQPTDRFTVTDLITGSTFTWGSDNYVRLDAFGEPVHILHVHYPKTAPSPKGR